MKAITKTRRIFCEALDKKTAQEREAYLAEACQDNPALQSEIEALLKAHSRSDEFLRGPILGVGPSLEVVSVSEGPGTVIGRYKLLERIGEGGMAVVYLAEQERPIRRQVALKIIKLGMDTQQVIARFDQERQVLAIMDHPNIAKVIDAGATETGRPYFVMELVEGPSITEYCDENRLNTRQRLDLFIKVCEAIQHAHQKGIIHRDIKPSNVLIALRDGKPVPKIIDFGIAKATSQKLTEKTLFTQYAQVVGTPAYMSPEQAEFSELDIDTRTDIYSLGVLLYELLTGATPFDAEALRESGYAEMQRVIQEEEPLKPSTKVSTLGGELADVAEHRNSNPELLPKVLRGDLDWIVMKALEKERTRRYGTAAGFGEDIIRHLKYEPVEAAAPSTLYRLSRLVRRNRVVVTAGALILVVLIAGIVSTSIGFMQARTQGEIARGNFEQARNAVDEIMQVSRLRITGAASVEEAQAQLEILGKGQAFYSRFLQDNPDDRQMIEEWGRSLEVLGETYMRVANYDQAEAAYRKAIEAFEGLIGRFSDEAVLQREIAISQSGLSYALLAQGRQDEAAKARTLCLENWRSDVKTYEFGTLAKLGPNFNTPYLDGSLEQRGDGLEMFFGSNRDGGYGHLDIWTATRASVDDEWSEPVNLGEPINTVFYDGTPAITGDGLEMIFPSVRTGGMGSCDLWVSRRTSTSEPWSPPENLGEIVNGAVWEGAPCLSSDGLSLFFGSSRSGGMGYNDLWMTTRASRNDRWGEPVNLGASVNSPHNDSTPCISPDGLALLFASARPGGFGDHDIWMATRAAVDQPWSEPANLGPGINTLFMESHPSLSPDGSVLYIGVLRPGPDGRPDYELGKDGLGTWEAAEVPILSLDGKDK